MSQFEPIDRWYQFNVHVSSRTIYMGSMAVEEGEETGTDFRMAESSIKGLHILDSAKEAPINIIMSNPGGDEVAGMAIYDAIRGARSHVTITVLGQASSMGSIILQAADYRQMSKNSFCMIHMGEWNLQGHPANVDAWKTYSDKSNKWMIDMYLEKIRQKHPGYRRNILKQKLKSDIILTAQETVDLGLADEVI